MRLLRRSDDGTFSLTGDIVGDDPIPQYAILSHTWGQDFDEVTFEDVTNGVGEHKLGYNKLRFCAEQAGRDGLQYFWIDTCCINKANYAELSLAINSMYRWYRDARRCYVYLTDVSAVPGREGDEGQDTAWESELRASRWLRRGWTLQELLAPSSIEFYSRERRRLGDRSSLIQLIHEATGIPMSALRGDPLSRFSVNERISWTAPRETELEEDRAYSLLGILDVYIPPMYGEGRVSAFNRLQGEIDKFEKCIKDLRLTDPRDDKKRIEDTKDGLLEESYRWILGNSDFQEWRDSAKGRLLWIKGDPGKGKTMLLCGIINELEGFISKSDVLSFFFCQATDSRINNATSVLRGLIFLLVYQQPSLVSHVRSKYDHAGKELFEDRNAWYALCEIMTDILQDPDLKKAYLIIDALDECTNDLPRLLDFIAQKSSQHSHVKWLVSSRNWPTIEDQLDNAGRKVKLSLELNAESISTAVSYFIRFKVSQLALDKKYSEETKDAVLAHLLKHADDTFLWVALVCQRLKTISRWNVHTGLNFFPPGLNSLYERMMHRISESDDAHLCNSILATVTTVYEPVTLTELTTLVKMLENVSSDQESLREIIELCGSFLTIKTDRVYFVHQSAKDYLLTKASSALFPKGKNVQHYEIFSASLQGLSKTLRRDIYGLSAPGYSIERIEQSYEDPLSALRYSCVHWVDHLLDSASNADGRLENGMPSANLVNQFLRKTYLYWLEALSLCRSISKGVVLIAKLEAVLQADANEPELLEIVEDARRFIMSYKVAIEYHPLQIYTSALLFSPGRSLIKNSFKEDVPGWVMVQPYMNDRWSTCLQTLEGHGCEVKSVVSTNGFTWLASAGGLEVNIWDTSNGTCLKNLQGHSKDVNSVAFSHNSAWLASGSMDGTAKIWDRVSGLCLQTFEHDMWVSSVAFSHDSAWLASASALGDMTIKIWDISSGTCLQTLEGHLSGVNSIAFSSNSSCLASGSTDRDIKIWDVNKGSCLLTLSGHVEEVHSVAFSQNSLRVASASSDLTVKIWDTENGLCLHTLYGHVQWVLSVAFSHDSARIASASADRTVKIWDGTSGACLQTLEGHTSWVRSVVFYDNSAMLASASRDETVKIWYLDNGAYLPNLEGYAKEITAIGVSHDSERLVSGSIDGTIKIWDTESGVCLKTWRGHKRWVKCLVFSHDSTLLASGSSDHLIKIWNVSSGDCLKTMEGHSQEVNAIAFSHDSTTLVSGSNDKTAKSWTVRHRRLARVLRGRTFRGHTHLVLAVAISHDSTRIATGSADMNVKIWDMSTEVCLLTLKGHTDWLGSVAFSHDSTWLASGASDKTIRFWNTKNGQCFQTLTLQNGISDLEFDATSTSLHTNIGTFVLDLLLDSDRNYSITDSPQPRYPRQWGLSADKAWVTYDSEDVVWIPSEYRSVLSIVRANILCIGTPSGKVWWCKFNSEEKTIPRRT